MDLLLQNSGTTVFLPSPPLFAEIRLIDSVPRGQFRLIRAATFPLLLLLFSSFFFMFHFISRSTYSYPFSLIPRIITIIVTFIYRDEEARVSWFLKEYEFEMNFIVVVSFFFEKSPLDYRINRCTPSRLVPNSHCIRTRAGIGESTLY